ncbi:hypothetical protein PPERSA_10661 [Pseudocohnilembus persalinus]|uniref:Uncharacterized protein n=1 Tax=Pseudocohnilembus persalinus TaxID=266149 RepID=A0A0V0QDA7_PSEPJ|nr:hypothetical protein PPERSA_10661 [Pseudocohnilembus persalinus]|eukprot:KRX00162.1 hypothetical protein PPERSA_10661 [Pseudocohnilembus persalinus]
MMAAKLLLTLWHGQELLIFTEDNISFLDITDLSSYSKNDILKSQYNNMQHVENGIEAIEWSGLNTYYGTETDDDKTSIFKYNPLNGQVSSCDNLSIKSFVKFITLQDKGLIGYLGYGLLIGNQKQPNSIKVQTQSHQLQYRF